MRPDAPPAAGSLTSDPDRFSDAAWDLLLASQEQARRWRHGQMDVEHLLQALFNDRRFGTWIDPLPIDLNRLLDGLDDWCGEQPAGAGRELFIGEALEELLEQADRRRQAWGSRLLDLPHVLLALLEEPRLGGALLADQGLSEELLLRELRRGPSEPVAPPPAAPPLAAPPAPAIED
ncbi:MAG: Clp protease N-terminal domain-containing protein, partial [Vulcanococcus sp.]